MGIWHYTDDKGTRHAVTLTEVQSLLDAQLVSGFQSIESTVADGRELPAKEAEAIAAQAKQLPPERAKHWLNELRRIGAKLPADKSAAPAAVVTPVPEAKK